MVWEKMESTLDGFAKVRERCKHVFELKLRDYGASWRLMRPNTVNDQILIKSHRIRSIEITKINMVGDSIESELIGIINYSIIGLIQMRKGYAESIDMTSEEASRVYDGIFKESTELMLRKNNDYAEAWRNMSNESFTDIILTKVYRNKTIFSHEGDTVISEGCDANFFDIINYAVFYLISLDSESDNE